MTPVALKNIPAIQAQNLMPLKPRNLFGPPIEAGDVNCSGGTDIVDALLIAQRYVGLDPAAWCR